RIQELLYRQSGILGVSGRSADLRDLIPDNRPATRLAIDMFCHRVARETAALAVSLGGLDVIAFTGGIGEHRAEVREDVCRQLSFLGVAIDAERNRAASGTPASAIHADGSAVEVWVVPTDEGRVAATEAARLLSSM
ncbi:MAG: acetate kinase, partial [Burkholderiales bacterium]